MEPLYFLLPIALGVPILLLFYWWRRRKHGAPIDQGSAQARFAHERTRLQTAFLQAASASGKPRGLRWKECQWNDLIEWVRDKQTGHLLALVGVTISFEAIEGSDMEGVEAVGNLRNATAVFFFDGEWRTVGRVVFNLNPDEALAHFKSGFERVTEGA